MEEFVMDVVDDYKRMLEWDPSSQVFQFLAEELCARQLWEEAVQTCHRGLAFHPYNTRAKVLLCKALWHLGHASESEQLLHEARKDLEKNVVLYKMLAEIAEMRGDIGLARYYMTIFSIFQSVGDEDLEPEFQTHKAPEELVPEEPLILRTLSGLYSRLEQAPGDPSRNNFKEHRIFDESQRQALQRIILSMALKKGRT